jgi:hypothetical protein
MAKLDLAAESSGSCVLDLYMALVWGMASGHLGELRGQ